MLSNYILYLYTLPKGTQIEQVFILLSFSFIFIIIGILLDYWKLKFYNDQKAN